MAEASSTEDVITLRIRFKSETIEKFAERYAADFSQNEVFVRTREPLAVGTALAFDFTLTDGSPLLAGRGSVSWVREPDLQRATPSGMGIRFESLNPVSRQSLAIILAGSNALPTSGPLAPTPPYPFPAAVPPGLGNGERHPDKSPVGAGNRPPSFSEISAVVAERTSERGPGAHKPHLEDAFTDEDAERTEIARLPPSFYYEAAEGEQTRHAGDAALDASMLDDLDDITSPRTEVPPPVASAAPPTRPAKRAATSATAPTPAASSELPRRQTPPAGSLASALRPPGQPAVSGGRPNVGVPAAPISARVSESPPHAPPLVRPHAPPSPLGDPPAPPAFLSGAAFPFAPPRHPTPMSAPPLPPPSAPPTFGGDLGLPADFGAGGIDGPGAGRLEGPPLPPPQWAEPGEQAGRAPPPPGTARTWVAMTIAAAAVVGLALWLLPGMLKSGIPAPAPAVGPSLPTPSEAVPSAASTPPSGTAAVPSAPVAAPSVPPTGTAAAPVAASPPAAGPPAANTPPAGQAAPAVAAPAATPPVAAAPAAPAVEHPAARPRPVRSRRSPSEVIAAAEARERAGTPAPATAPSAPTAPATGDSPAGPAVTESADEVYWLSVRSTPSGADVVIDGQVEGKTPFQRRIFDPNRSYALTVRRAGYEPLERTVSGSDQWVKKGNVRTLTVTTKLNRLAGTPEPAAAGADEKTGPAAPATTPPAATVPERKSNPFDEPAPGAPKP